MKFLLSLSTIFLISFSNKPPINIHPTSFLTKDTSFKHVLDGKATEWPSQKFEMDAGTGIKYAVDNDQHDLYLALLIPDQRMQIKMMRQGMDLYIDLKGKKKEGKGIEFPVKRDPSENEQLINSGNSENPAQETPEQRKAKMKAMRATMALNLASMKVFGFSSNEPDEQGLLMQGSANVAFAWDSTDAMCIEYRIPDSLISISSISEKEISLGWKINGFQKPTHPASSESSEGSHGRGGRGGGYGGQGNRSAQDFENFMKDQSFWTKYTFK
ncbi:MAG TPA: hypothetical protein VGG71_09005 [Chitinophagaceae bacterium]